MKVFRAFALVGLVLAIAMPASALSLPTAPFRMKMTDYDNGSLYAPLAPGGTLGVADNPAAGIPLMDAALLTAPAGGQPGTIGTTEDSWGIAKITLIQSFIGGVWVETYNAATAPTELTWIFYGNEDYFLHQLNSEVQLINGVGLHADLYEQAKVGGTAFDPSAGSAGRTSASTYNTVTDGTLILALASTPGHLHGVGVEGGFTAEFETQFNVVTGNSDGDAYFDVVGGTMANEFDTDTLLSPFGGNPADIHAHFTAFPTGVGPDPSLNPTAFGIDWLVESDDPIRGAFIPEPFTMAGVLMGLASVGGYIRRRNTK